MELKKNDCLLSVIVPVYNTKQYLARCMDALVAQTLCDMEIIIIDDCSDENIEEVILPYIESNCKKIYFERLNHRVGPGGARNRGIEIATGKYIAFCDSDDWVDVTYYDVCVETMERYNACMGMCSLVRVYDYMQKKTLYKCKYEHEIHLNGDYALKIMTKQIDVEFLIIPSTINKIYRRSFLDEIKLRFVEERLFEDLLFSFISVMNAKKIICIPTVLYHHYKRPNSIVQSFDKKHIDDFIDIFSLLKNHLELVGCYEKYMFNYYKFLEQFYNLIVREIFEFVIDEKQQKDYLAYSFQKIKNLIVFEEYMEYTTAEQLRQHIQPHISDTTIY